MRAGALRYRITLESPSETAPSGEGTVTWTTVATVWAEMLGTGGFETSGLEAQATYRLRLRYRSDVTSRWRVGIGATRKLQIMGPPQDPDGLQRELIVMVRETV